MVTLLMLLMNPYIAASFYLMPITSVYACTSGSYPSWYSTSLSRFLWSDWSSVASLYLYLKISFTRSIADFLTVVYSAGAGIVLKSRQRKIRARFSMMAMHVDTIHMFAWMRRYAASISVLPIMMCFYGHLMCLSAIMWSIMRRHNP